MTAKPRMPLYIADHLADTAHLNAAQTGAYLHLIFHYWTAGGLPAGDAALAIAGDASPTGARQGAKAHGAAPAAPTRRTASTQGVRRRAVRCGQLADLGDGMNGVVFVYVAATRQGNGAVAPVTVGISSSPTERIRGLSTASPHPLELIHAIPCTWDVARRSEAESHRALAGWRLNGEWFSPHPREVVDLVAAVIECVGGSDYQHVGGEAYVLMKRRWPLAEDTD
jgi:hypothetical protein